MAFWQNIIVLSIIVREQMVIFREQIFARDCNNSGETEEVMKVFCLRNWMWKMWKLIANALLNTQFAWTVVRITRVTMKLWRICHWALRQQSKKMLNRSQLFSMPMPAQIAQQVIRTQMRLPWPHPTTFLIHTNHNNMSLNYLLSTTE